MFSDLKGYRPATLRADAIAALTVTFMVVPQGIAYARIADLPPAVGLYASALPAIVGALFRSSRFVVSGPTNALSLLVGGGLAVGMGADPLVIAFTLAALVGVMQVAAGVLRLSAVVDFISSPVVLGYITGAAVLIGAGQLQHLTGTEGARGSLIHRMIVWFSGLGGTQMLPLAVSAGTAALVIGLKKVHRKMPAAMLAIVIATLVSVFFGFDEMGLATVGSISPVPRGLPPLTIPDLSLVPMLLPLAGATTVLSLIESTSVARALAAETGDTINPSVEFIGQGLSNIAAGFTGGYPVSGSPSRSAFNLQAGAQTRISGVIIGLLMIGVLLAFGPLIDHIPIAALAALIVLVAVRLLDPKRLMGMLRSTWADRISLVATIIGTWTLNLDHAIYLGVGLSVIFFLRQARLLQITELLVDADGRLRQSKGEKSTTGLTVLNVEGQLFYAAAGDLRAALDAHMRRDGLKTLVIRLRRTQGMDISIAEVLRDLALALREREGQLYLSGLCTQSHTLLKSIGFLEIIGEDHVFPAEGTWLGSLSAAANAARQWMAEGDAEAQSLFVHSKDG